MMGGIDQQVKQAQLSAGSDPQQLAQRYKKTRSLIDLLAMQKMKSDKEAATKEMQMQMQNQPKTIIEQREAELMGQTQQEIQQKIAPGMAMAGKASMPQQGMPQQGPPQGMPQQGPQGTGFARGGIVSFAGPEGSFVEEPNMFGLEGGTEVMGYDGQPKLTHTGEQRTTAMKRQIDKALEELMARGASPQEAIAKVSNFIRSPNSPEGEYLQQLKDEVNAKAPDLAQRPPAEPMSIPSPAPSVDIALEQLTRSKGDTPQPPPVAQGDPIGSSGPVSTAPTSVPPTAPSVNLGLDQLLLSKGDTPQPKEKGIAADPAQEGIASALKKILRPPAIPEYPNANRNKTAGGYKAKPEDFDRANAIQKDAVGAAKTAVQPYLDIIKYGKDAVTNRQYPNEVNTGPKPAGIPAALPQKSIADGYEPVLEQSIASGYKPTGETAAQTAAIDAIKGAPPAGETAVAGATPAETHLQKMQALALKEASVDPTVQGKSDQQLAIEGTAGSRAKMGAREKKLEGLEKLMAIYNDPDKLWREKGYAMLAGAGGQTTASGALGGLNIAGLNATNRQQEGLKNDYLSVLKELDSQYKDQNKQETDVIGAYTKGRESSQLSKSSAIRSGGVMGVGELNAKVRGRANEIAAKFNENREKDFTFKQSQILLREWQDVLTEAQAAQEYAIQTINENENDLKEEYNKLNHKQATDAAKPGGTTNQLYQNRVVRLRELTRLLSPEATENIQFIRQQMSIVSETAGTATSPLPNAPPTGFDPSTLRVR